jgi:transmembrane sensor
VAFAVQLLKTPDSTPAAPVASVPSAPAEIITGEAELATVRLPDGSVVRLGPRSRLRLEGTNRERTVWIAGHAFFAVAKDSSRPFRVRTAEGDLIALGTRFDVRTEPRGVHLAVLEGRVALLANGERTEVASGESAGVREGRTSPVVKISDLSALTSWMRRFLAFQDTPLLSVAMEIERVYGRPVVLADASIVNETVTATLTDASLEEAVRVVCAVVDLRCAITDAQVTIAR